MAGDLTLAQARQIALKSFGNWKGTAPAVTATAAPRTGATRIRLVNKPGAVQTGIVMGNADQSLRASLETFSGCHATATNDEDGVAVAIEKFILRK